LHGERVEPKRGDAAHAAGDHVVAPTAFGAFDVAAVERTGCEARAAARAPIVDGKNFAVHLEQRARPLVYMHAEAGRGRQVRQPRFVDEGLHRASLDGIPICSWQQTAFQEEATA